MIRVDIDGKQVTVRRGTTLMEAARAAGIRIPGMCALEGFPPFNACMLCVVEVVGTDHLVPACAARVEDGMVVRTQSPRVAQARRTALELLLSEHLGDCEGPCRRGCPAGMDIPAMVRSIAAGRLQEAYRTVKEHIALPAALGRICSAPCEAVCRRGKVDAPVAICLLKRFVADEALRKGTAGALSCLPDSGRTVAVVGAGPAGLAAAQTLVRAGHGCVLLDENPKPGGSLRHAVGSDRLPRDVLEAEAASILELGVDFRGAVILGRDVSLPELVQDYDAVVLCTGEHGKAEPWGVTTRGNGRILCRDGTFDTGVPHVWAAGAAVHPMRMAVRAVAHGRSAALAVDQTWREWRTDGRADGAPFDCRLRLLDGEELERMLEGASRAGRIVPANSRDGGLSAHRARGEAERCMHCDCRKRERCALRKYAGAYHASQKRFPGEPGEKVVRIERAAGVVYEPGKCIKCGRCVRLTERAGEIPGVAFLGRGFAVEVGSGFATAVGEALGSVAAECVRQCPTGALARLDEED